MVPKQTLYEIYRQVKELQLAIQSAKDIGHMMMLDQFEKNLEELQRDYPEQVPICIEFLDVKTSLSFALDREVQRHLKAIQDLY